ncbi:MAG: choice-of-anchor B family protein [Altibacter sp.]|nr:choice-of-anchor B family protein [Altibacter sp.]
MKKLILLAILLNSMIIIAQAPCSGGTAGGYPCNGLDLKAYKPLTGTLGLGASSTGNDSWGWTDPQDGKEYAIVGLDNGTAFLEVTATGGLRHLGKLPTQTSSSSWRDVKVYQNHAFIVSEASNHGMQVFDLKRLRGLSENKNRVFTNDAHYNGFGKAHNIIINEDSGFAYILGANANGNGGPIVLNIQNPTSPTFAAYYAGMGYSHDAQVITYNGPDTDYTGREIYIGSNEDKVVILDVTNKANIQHISNLDYSYKRYTHQGWFTEDQRYFLLGDEQDEYSGGNAGNNTRTIIFDFNDLDNPVEHFQHFGATLAIDHNGYVRGNRFYIANYSAGMRVIKISDIANQNIQEVAYFDTYTPNNTANFNGAWNVYPYFESGNIIISNYDRGLFVVKDPNYDNVDPVVICQPFTATLDKNTGSVTISALDVDGGSTDNKGIVSRTLTGQTTFTCDDVGSTFDVTLTVEDDYGNKASCVATVTVAAETTAYLGGGSWSNGAPGIGSNAKISTDYKTTDILNPLNTSIDACTCEVDAARTLTVSAGDYINITKDITVNGSLVVEHTGSVVQTDDTATVNNNGNSISVALETPILQTRDFMVMGSPMTAETRNDVFTNAFLVLNQNPGNFIPHPGVPAGGTNFADDNNNFWTSYSGSIDVGKGYIVRPQSGYTDPANHTYAMTYTKGTLNNGVVSRPIFFNGLGSNPDGTPNVLANPYPSAISAIDLINANPLINEIYFWEHLTAPSPSIPGAGSINFSMDDISMYNLSGGVKAANDPGASTTPNGVISTGQGFAIKAMAAGAVTFDNSMRLTSGNTTLRNPADELEIDRIWINVRNAEYEIGSNALIAFNPTATPQWDAGYDSQRLATAISLYSHMDNNPIQLGIQTRESFDPSTKISMGFASQVNANAVYTISLENMEGMHIGATTVYLLDNETNILTNLSESTYEFESNKGTFDQRFTLMFESDTVLDTAASILVSITTYPNPTDDVVTIYSPNAVINDIEVFDLRGRRVVEIMDKEDHHYVLNLSDLETAIYFVKVSTEVGSITKKVIKK